MEPGRDVSLVAQRYGVPNFLYRWKKQMTEGREMAYAAITDGSIFSGEKFCSES